MMYSPEHTDDRAVILTDFYTLFDVTAMEQNIAIICKAEFPEKEGAGPTISISLVILESVIQITEGRQQFNEI